MLMDEFPLTIFPMKDNSITEGYLRAIRQPERSVAVDHPADAAFLVGLESASHDLHLAFHRLRLSPHRLHEGLKALPPFVGVGADEHRSLLARNVALEEGKVASCCRLVETQREIPEFVGLLHRCATLSLAIGPSIANLSAGALYDFPVAVHLRTLSCCP